MIDLRSDTVTKPSQAMREAMAAAPVGDDTYGEDPTVNRLQELAASLLGKEAALFVPSGIMANQLAIRVQTQPGDEVIVESRSHIVRYEQGGAAALAGVQLHWVEGRRGLLTAPQVEAAIRTKAVYNPTTSLICLENTHNNGGGSVYPLSAIEAIRKTAQAHAIPMHLDGARLFNAVVASGTAASAYAAHFDTVSFCLSKGLGAPAGSLIATDARTVERLRRLRRMYGGSMRQAGILAAAGLYALEHNLARLQDDHAHAKQLALALQPVPTVAVDVASVETNIVLIALRNPRRPAATLVSELQQAGVLVSAIDATTIRAVTHLDVGAADIDEAGRILAAVLSR